MPRIRPLIALVLVAGLTGWFTLPAPAMAQDAPDRTREIQPYATVVPTDARTTRGFLTIHRVGERVLLELPSAMLGLEMILAMRENTAGWEQRTIRWERYGERIFLRVPVTLTSNDAEYAAWLASRRDDRAPVEGEFAVEAVGPDGAVVIDATRLFVGALPGLSPVQGQTDERRTAILSVAAHPDNVVIEALHTAGPPPVPPGPVPAGAPPRRSETSTVHWSLIRMPERPMRPRLHDERFGYFVARPYSATSRWGFYFGLDPQETRANITRWRLEKSDPGAALSTPTRPIVLYIDPGTPEKWRTWVRAGIMEWEPAFEAAGFRDAVEVREVPADDPDWSMDDVRHSMISWAEPRALEGRRLGGGTATFIFDERTGEILRADVRLGAGLENLGARWYFAQAGAVDPAAQSLPLADAILGRMVQYVVSHEFGHALGLQDGNYGKFSYPVEEVRSREWVRKMGHSPSVLNYARVNYVAQPEDGIPPFDLVPAVGPADIYQIRWGYSPIPSAATPEAELPTLNEWAREQDSVPWYRFVRSVDARGHPYTSDANDDADPVRSTGYGVLNLKRLMGILERATLRTGVDNRDLEEYYAEVHAQWLREMRRVVDLVGGFTIHYKTGDQPGPVYAPVEASRQREAVQFLATSAFQTPHWLVNTELTRRFEGQGAVARMVSMQTELIERLLDIRRLHHLSEAEILAADARAIYSLTEMLEDLQRAVWTELERPEVAVDGWRQGLQQGMLLVMRDLLAAPPEQERSFRMLGSFAGSGEKTPHLSAFERAALRAALTALQEQIEQRRPLAQNASTRAHLDASRALIGEILRPDGRREAQ